MLDVDGETASRCLCCLLLLLTLWGARIFCTEQGHRRSQQRTESCTLRTPLRASTRAADACVADSCTQSWIPSHSFVVRQYSEVMCSTTALTIVLPMSLQAIMPTDK